MSNHTPGPWESREVDGLFAIAHRDGWVLESNDIDRDRADAKLIAESPEMYQIVQRLATCDWMSEKELSMWARKSREIMERINL